ncbi:MAG: zinc-ribbon domain-containing protein [Pseudomonadota bacterium]
MSRSGKQRRSEIKQRRLARAQRLQAEAALPDVRWVERGAGGEGVPGVEPADRAILASRNNTCGPLPERYVDKPFVCRDCGEEQVWTAKQQKWWYEIALGAIDSTAVRCLPCRRRRRTERARDGADALGEACARIRALGDRPPDSAARQDVEAALTHKWWGVRVVAIGVLGRWGGPEAVARLKAFVEAGAESTAWRDWPCQGQQAALSALGGCLPASEIPWAVECVLSGGIDHWPLRRRLAHETSADWDALLDAEWRRDDPERLVRLGWLLGGLAADAATRARWQQRFLGHPNPRVRRMPPGMWLDARRE